MKSHYLTATLFLFFLLFGPAGPLSAQMPAAEPLPAPSPMTKMMSGLNPANWKMPKLPSMSRFLPTKAEKERVIKKKNGLVDEVSTTAKKSWQRTKDTLNPMKLIPAGFRKDGTQAASKPKSEGGFFRNLFAPFPKEPEMPTNSVTDWLKQDAIR
ncbi:MAG: hypothetical protein AAF802_06520 [Planctomycetota bacterium]